MRKLPKELTIELLGLVLDKKIISFKRCNLHYAGITQDNNNIKVFIDEYLKIINIDTLTRLMKEWCEKNIEDISDTNYGFINEIWSNSKTCKLIYTSGVKKIFYRDSEFEAILYATHWIATEKGLI